MIKFIEKIFSGLAYQIGKFLFFVLLAIAICFLVDKDKLFDIIGLWRVNAETQYVNVDEFQTTPRLFAYNCSSSTNCTTELTTTYNPTDFENFIFLENNVSIGPSGVNLVYQLNQKLQPNYLYSITSWVCSPTTANKARTVRTGLTSSGAYKSDMVYSSTTWGQIDAHNFYFAFNGSTYDKLDIGIAYGGEYQYCTAYQSVVSPATEGSWLSLHLYRDTLLSNQNLMFIGYEIAELGLYTDSLKNTIDSSISSANLATAEDIDALNEEIKNQVEEQEKTNQKLDDINNTLTDSDTSQNNANDFFDTSSIVSSDGVVSSLLTLPIQMASKLVDNLGGTCTPYKMNFGMLGKDYTLNFPCIDLEDYLGSNLWHMIDLLFCGFMAYNIGMLFVSIYDSITSLQDYYYSYIYQSSHEEHTRENRRSRTPSE